MNLPQHKPPRFAQTELATHEAWAALGRRSPLASSIMHLLVSRVGPHNAVVISQSALAKLAKASKRGVQNAVKILAEERWVEIRQIGEYGTVNAYVINDRVAWVKARDGLRYSLFSATVVAVDTEQPDSGQTDALEPLRQIPSLYPDEGQLPNGPALPPVPDLPVRRISDE